MPGFDPETLFIHALHSLLVWLWVPLFPLPQSGPGWCGSILLWELLPPQMDSLDLPISSLFSHLCRKHTVFLWLSSNFFLPLQSILGRRWVERHCRTRLCCTVTTNVYFSERGKHSVVKSRTIAFIFIASGTPHKSSGGTKPQVNYVSLSQRRENQKGQSTSHDRAFCVM